MTRLIAILVVVLALALHAPVAQKPAAIYVPNARTARPFDFKSWWDYEWKVFFTKQPTRWHNAVTYGMRETRSKMVVA